MHLILTPLTITYIYSQSSYNRWIDRYFDEYQQQFVSSRLYYTYFLGYFLNTYFIFNYMIYMESILQIHISFTDLFLGISAVYIAYLMHLFLLTIMEHVLTFLNLDHMQK